MLRNRSLPGGEEVETLSKDSKTSTDDEPEPAGAEGGVPTGSHSDAGTLVVGIGSSAGGLEAMEEFLRVLPARPGFAVVVITHLDPEHQSNLASLLQRASEMEVVEATHGVRVEADRAYVMPANASLTIEDEVILLHERKKEQGFIHVVDRFFRSMAEDVGHRAIGVVLSGTLADGTQGLREIKAAGGFTLAQDPDTARFREMPRNAIKGGIVDFVGSPEDLAHEAMAIRDRVLDPDKGAMLRSPDQQRPGENPPEEGLDAVVSVLRNRLGVDFSQYKQTTLSRRVGRRMVATGQESLQEYARFLAHSDEEIHRLNEEILINVTRFFREPKTDRAVIEHVLPELLKDRPPDRALRVWVPGCATGEEVYSVAIIIMEFLQKHDDRVPLQIFATDLSESAIRTAREGFYPETIEDDVSPERLVRFFERSGSGYRVLKHVRGLCIFANHNLVTDPPFSAMDLVSCRNVLIYMESSLQRRVLSTLHYALRPSGFLVLGSSESVGVSSDLFMPHESFKHVFRKKDVVRSPVYEFTGFQHVGDRVKEDRSRPGPWGESEIQQAADRVLLDQYAPPGVVVNKDFRVIHFKGSIPYLEHPSGPANLDLLRMVPEALSTAVHGLVKEVREKKTHSSRRGVTFQVNGDTRSLTVNATPIHGPSQRDEYYLVTFIDGSGTKWRHERGADRRPLLKISLFGAKSKAEAEDRIKNLKAELAATREQLQFVVEDYEATMEELRSANEEAVSTNEELQSTNEELETTKEELQSTNEELTSLNDELQERNLEIQKANNDVVNLLNSVGYPIVMLGPDLSVRRFTSQATGFFNLKATDVGRPFTDIQPPFEAPGLQSMMVEVLKSFDPDSLTVSDAENRVWTIRFHPYRTLDHKVDGIVLVAIPGEASESGRPIGE